jgi:hypothetical protein
MVDRRTAIQWVVAASAALQMPLSSAAFTAEAATRGYGQDPDLLKRHAPGDLWPLTLSEEQRRAAKTLCDFILPADAEGPAASTVGVVEFIDEWISAPYPQFAADRKMILDGLAWFDDTAQQKFARRFADLASHEAVTLCDESCRQSQSGFFARYRQLTAVGYYTTPVGMRDLGYVGNVALASYDGPPPAVMKQIGMEP